MTYQRNMILSRPNSDSLRLPFLNNVWVVQNSLVELLQDDAVGITYLIKDRCCILGRRVNFKYSSVSCSHLPNRAPGDQEEVEALRTVEHCLGHPRTIHSILSGPLQWNRLQILSKRATLSLQVSTEHCTTLMCSGFHCVWNSNAGWGWGKQ